MKMRYWKVAGLVSVFVGLSVTNVTASTLTLTVSEELQTGGITSYSVENQDEFSQILTNGSGSASLASLKSFNSMTSGFTYTNRSAWEITDVFLTPDTPGTDSATVILGGQLTAVMAGFDGGGVFDGANGSIAVDYTAAYNLGGNQFLSSRLYLNQVNSFQNEVFSLEIDEFVGVTLSLPTNIPITFAMTLETVANVNGNGSATVNASNSLNFNPNNFLNILTPGVTANAGSYIVDNTLPAFSAVPVPAAAWLFGSGLIGLIGLSRRNKRFTREQN